MKPAVKYGLLNGGVAIAWSLMMYITELNRNSSAQWVQIIALAFPIIFMVMTINEYKATVGGGWITFGKAFNQAFKVGLIGSLIGVGFYYIYITAIDPGFIEYQKQLEIQKMIDKGMSDEVIEQADKQIDFFLQPWMQMIFAFLASIFFSAVMALIVAAVKKHPNPEEIS